MGLRDRLRRKEDAAAKAATPSPEAYGGATKDLSTLVDQLVRAQGGLDMGPNGAPLPRDQWWRLATFGPDQPLTPEPLDRPGRETGWVEPRIWQYPVAYNLQIPGQYHTQWDTLRRAADTPIYRACIEVRKTELATMDWVIRVDQATTEKIARKNRRAAEDVAQQLRGEYEAEIDRLTDFLETPDRKNGVDFSDWISLLMEEQLVWDAVAIYPRKTYGGQTLDLTLIDGSTIKPLLNEYGGRPEPPYPAYQQLLYGFPRGEFTADTIDINGQPVVDNALTTSQLIYRRRVRRNWTPYGYSPTEQALLSGLLFSKRFEWMMAEYTEGSMPAQFIKNTGDEGEWTANQILDWEKAFNDRYSGKTKERMRFPLMPPGLEPVSGQQIGERYKADYDLHLIKLVCMHYGVTVTELGFPETGGLGTQGFHEGQEDVLYRKARLPDVRWTEHLINQILRQQLNMPKDLEFAFLGLDEEDEAATDQVAERQLATGRRTLNEDRARLGLPAFNFREADMPMLQTQRGVVFFDGSSTVAPPGVLVEPASESNDMQGDDASTPTTPAAASGKPGNKTKPVRSVSNTPAKKAELVTLDRWLAKHSDPARPFECEHLTAEDAPDFADDPRVAFKASGAGPKVTVSLDGKEVFRTVQREARRQASQLGQHGSETWHLSPYTALR